MILRPQTATRIDTLFPYSPLLRSLVLGHVPSRLADGLHWRRADVGPLVGEGLAASDREGRGALVLLGEAHRSEAEQAEALLARIRQQPQAEPARAGALAEWRRNGAGSQILADLGLGKLRVLGTPSKPVGLAGYGLEVVEYLESA